MKLIKFIDHEGEEHFINKEFIISIRPFYPFHDDDHRHSVIEYGNGWMDAVYMKEKCYEVVNHIAMSTMPKRSTI